MTNIEKYLDKVEKPSRYVGGEYNSIIKNKKDVNIRVAFCFPDTYEIGMSHLGLRCIYHVLNNIPDVWCERSFMPWVDMEEIMRENNIPLYALESKDSLENFDMLGFTLQYEMSYTNVLAMLDLSNIPFLSKDRDNDAPIICAGGPCTVNPEPIADIIDFFMVGEGEEVWPEIIELYRECKAKENYSKDEFLLKVANIKGVYVPKFYDVSYNEDGTIKERTLLADVPEVIQKRVIEDFESLSDLAKKFVTIDMDDVHQKYKTILDNYKAESEEKIRKVCKKYAGTEEERFKLRHAVEYYESLPIQIQSKFDSKLLAELKKKHESAEADYKIKHNEF